MMRIWTRRSNDSGRKKTLRFLRNCERYLFCFQFWNVRFGRSEGSEDAVFKLFDFMAENLSCWMRSYTIFKVFFLCFIDRASRYIRAIKTNLMQIYPQFISSINFYMFRAYLWPITSRYTVYIQQLVRFVFSFNCLLVSRPTDSQLKTQNIAIVVYIQYTSWWWATNMPETYRSLLKK